MSDPTLPLATEAARPTPRRPLNTTALVVGLILLGLSGLWWADEGDVVPAGAAVYVLPVLLIGAGIVGLVAFVLRGRAPQTPSATWTPPPAHPTHPDPDSPDPHSPDPRQEDRHA